MANKNTKPKAKHPGGRPSKYNPDYCNQIVDYFNDESILPIPLFADFALKINVSRDTLHQWRKDHQEFSDAYKKAAAIQKARWIKGSLKGEFNPAFTIFFGKNVFKWRDKKDVEHTGTLTIEDKLRELSGDNQ